MTRQDEVPAELRRLWGLSEPARLGRRAELDVTSVVAAAIELADRDGLAGVTLPKVAKALGFTSMSLYRYVGSKDELLVLMRDAGLGAPPPIDTSRWRDGLRAWADAQRDVYARRPWLIGIPLSGPPSGPHEIAWMEVALASLARTGLGWMEKVGVLGVLGGYVRHSVQLSHEMAEGRGEQSQASAEREYGRALAGLVTAERFPETAKLFGSAAFETPATDDYAFGLGMILDGIAAALR
ncbi:TetR/AcrR family transcriptional regulator [Amycolatopsis sp. CA-230715]|uniref:TetR/AcrR family transcriptional regulator n=1 Tax=Amycolatopsis sp. CA-230715 TaxID=2745196 RepID=UPI001C027D5A|nr:TetR/AcrR family transcriptional regulator [Amycolatopsis sp. CA-230715]